MTAEQENERLRAALKECLEWINGYFGLSDEQAQAAIEEAISDPENWSPYRHHQ